jgi:DMSO/TMAO reductase YedYZ molybdopterin-dependent catalytic subunit
MTDTPRILTPDAALRASRRGFLQRAAAGTIITALAGGLYSLMDPAEAYAENRDDGRARVPPGQRVIRALKPMGGEEGDPSRKKYRLRVHGAVDSPFAIDFAELLAMKQSTLQADVHCVTGWTVLDAKWRGVQLKRLAKRAGVKKSARYVIFEAAGGYTANLPLRDALKPNVLVTYELNGRRLKRAHGTPVRALVPDLYFWKSAKWLTGIRFSRHDRPGYWEKRGYHNRADPWKEERYG